MPARPPVIYNVKNKNGTITRSIAYKEKGKTIYIPIYSDLSDEELIESIRGGYDELSLTSERSNQRLSSKKTEEEFDPSDILKHRGLYDDEIEYLARKLNLYKHGYLGIYNIDTIKDLAKSVSPGQRQFGFIFNTDKSSGKGKHWIAVAYNKKNKELDYYDSLANEPTDEFLEQIKPVIDKLDLPYELRFKVNYIPRQGKSWNCGWHALFFLNKVLVEKQPFAFATGYSNIQKGEEKIGEFKNKFKKFGYI